MKELVIYLILAKGTLLPISILDTSCSNWYNNNVEIKERIIKLKIEITIYISIKVKQFLDTFVVINQEDNVRKI